MSIQQLTVTSPINIIRKANVTFNPDAGTFTVQHKRPRSSKWVTRTVPAARVQYAIEGGEGTGEIAIMRGTEVDLGYVSDVQTHLSCGLISGEAEGGQRIYAATADANLIGDYDADAAEAPVKKKKPALTVVKKNLKRAA